MRVRGFFLILFFASTAAFASSEKDFQDRLDFAEGLYARDMYKLALAEYDNLVRDYPQHPKARNAYFRAAESLFFDGQYEAAEPRLRAYLKQFPGAPAAEAAQGRAHIGESLYHLGRTDEALAELEPLFSSPSGRIRQTARYFSGKAYFEKGSRDAAEIHFKAVIETRDEKLFVPFARYYMGEIMLERGDPESAQAYFKQAAESGREELRWTARFGLGKALFALGRYAEAGRLFQDVYRSSPDPQLAENAFLNFLHSLYGQGAYDALLERSADEGERIESPDKRQAVNFLEAMALAKKGEAARANDVYDAILRDPDSSTADRDTAHLRKIELLIERGELDAALERLAGLASSQAKNPDRFILLKAETLGKLRRTGEAAAELDAFIRNFPKSPQLPEAMLKRGYFYIEMDKGLEARRALWEYFKRYPKSPFGPKALYDIVLLDIKLGLKKESVRDSLLFIRRFPKNPLTEKVVFRLGSLYTETGKNGRADAVFAQFLKDYPQSEKRHEVPFHIGANRQRSGDYKAAVESYAEVQPEKVSKEIYYATLKNRAYARVVLERFDEAAADYSRIVSDFPENDLTPKLYFWLVDYYLKKPDPARARTVLERFRSRPQAAEHAAEIVYFDAESLRLEGRAAEALAAFEACAAGGGAFEADCLFGKGKAHRSAGNTGLAEQSFKAALDGAGDDHELAVRARNELAELLILKENYAEAAKAYLAIGILYDDPAWVPDALNKAARAFEKAGRPEEAKQVTAELERRFPGKK